MELSSPAQLPEASQVLGWYGNLSTGQDWTRDFSVCLDPSSYGDTRCSADSVDALSAHDNGLIFDASVGYIFRGGFRLEGEMNRRRDALADLRSDLSDEQGQVQQLSLMLNGMYDFDTQSPLTPFIGAGVGGVRVNSEQPGLPDSEFDFSADDSVRKLGVQGFAGLQYQFSPSLTLGVRYTQKIVGKLSGETSFDSQGGLGSVDEGDLRSRALMLTLTYEFGAP
jgi:opacity protein-like surface antigen